MTTILIIFMFFLVYLEVRLTFLWLLSMVLSSFSQSHWHCLCWVLVKTLPCILFFSLCSRGNKNIFVSYGEHYNRFWRWPLNKVTSIIRTNMCLKLCFQWWETCIAYPRSSLVFLWCCHGSLEQRWNDEGKHTSYIGHYLSICGWYIMLKKLWKESHEHKSSNCGANKQGSYEVGCLSCPLSRSCSVLRMCLLIIIKFLSARGWYQADKSTTKERWFITILLISNPKKKKKK
jgi:hypothetical protein